MTCARCGLPTMSSGLGVMASAMHCRCFTFYSPAPNAAVPAGDGCRVVPQLTEADVRRIAREEVQGRPAAQPANAAEQSQPDAGAEPNMRHPKIQALIGAKARRGIELQLVEQLLDEGPDCDVSAVCMDYWHGLHDKLKAALEGARKPLVLKGIGKINGDGWKDTTKIGEVVHVWNRELPEPYAAGQFPRIGHPVWSASTAQYDFRPVSDDEAVAVIDRTIEELRMEVAALKDATRAEAAQQKGGAA